MERNPKLFGPDYIRRKSAICLYFKQLRRFLKRERGAQICSPQIPSRTIRGSILITAPAIKENLFLCVFCFWSKVLRCSFRFGTRFVFLLFLVSSFSIMKATRVSRTLIHSFIHLFIHHDSRAAGCLSKCGKRRKVHETTRKTSI